MQLPCCPVTTAQLPVAHHLLPHHPMAQAQSALQGLLPQGGGVSADYAGAIDVLEVLQASGSGVGLS